MRLKTAPRQTEALYQCPLRWFAPESPLPLHFPTGLRQKFTPQRHCKAGLCVGNPLRFSSVAESLELAGTSSKRLLERQPRALGHLGMRCTQAPHFLPEEIYPPPITRPNRSGLSATECKPTKPVSLKMTVFKSSTPHQSALLLFVAPADPNLVCWALNALGCHWKNQETRARNPEAPSQEHGKTLVFKPATFRGFRNGADTGGLLESA